MKIYIIPQCGYGDIIYVYSFIKNLKMIFDGEITLMSSSKEFIDRYAQLFPDGLVQYHHFSNHIYMHDVYWNPKLIDMVSIDGLRYFLKIDPEEEFVIYYLYKATISISNSTHPLIVDSHQKQIDFYGEDVFQKYMFRKPIYGNGDIPLDKIWAHFHNIPCDFYDSRELLEQNEVFNSFEPPYGDYVTIHQWGFIYENDYNTKFWDHEYWDTVVDHLLERQIKVYQVGGPNEVLLHPNIESLLGQQTFMQAAKTVSSSRLHIDVEGSFVHISALCNNPCVALCGPSLNCWRHLDADNIVYLEAKGVCDIAPCELNEPTFAKACGKKHHACMKFIHPQRVIDEIDRIFR